MTSEGDRIGDPSFEPDWNARRVTSRWAPLTIALVFLVALNLRPALTSVGPLLPQIGEELRLVEGAQGMLGALPLLAFALISPLVHHPARRFGMDRTLLAALVFLTIGVVARSFTGDAGLWVGTVVIGAAIAVGNVLVPTIVKRDYRNHISLATGVYSACIMVATAVASAVAAPMSTGAGWRGALAFWAIPVAIVTLLWIPRATAGTATPASIGAPGPASVSVWRQGAAWLVTAFMGLKSLTFYTMVTWLPTIETASGISAEQAGFHLFLYQIVSVASGLAIPRLMRRPTARSSQQSQRVSRWSSVLSACCSSLR